MPANPRHYAAYKSALVKEAKSRLAHMPPVQTLYFGGGTPSLWPALYYREMYDAIAHINWFLPNAEITLEANPQDITPRYLEDLHTAGITRVSLGVQSFDDENLHRIGRGVQAKQNRQALEYLGNSAFAHHFSLDLIFALPGQTSKDLSQDIDKALAYNPPHISLYELMHLEENNAKLDAASEPCIETLYVTRDTKLREHGYAHYEISNFATSEASACRHNVAFWEGKDYIGLGASAESMQGLSIRNNDARLRSYLRGDSTIHNVHPTEAWVLLLDRRLRLLNRPLTKNACAHLWQGSQKAAANFWETLRTIAYTYGMRVDKKGIAHTTASYGRHEAVIRDLYTAIVW